MDQRKCRARRENYNCQKPEMYDLINVTIFQFNNDYELTSKILQESKYQNKKLGLEDVTISSLKNENFSKNKVEKYLIESNYDYAKINTLFNNADTVSFIDLTLNKNKMVEIGYNETFLKETCIQCFQFLFLIFNDCFSNCTCDGFAQKIRGV